jgi:DNA-directed RNA polymerase specialized sigma24 family protein
MPPRQDARTEVSETALKRLMSRLAHDPDVAGERYEELRRTLIRFFKWRGAWAPEDCADQALDRLARKLEEGEEIADVRAFAYGIARLVLLEQSRHAHARHVALDDSLAAPAAAPDSMTNVGLLDCVERCLDELAADARALILRYYMEERRSKIDHRAAMAQELGVTASALRSRVQRLRDRVERCASDCARTTGIDPGSRGRRSA